MTTTGTTKYFGPIDMTLWYLKAGGSFNPEHGIRAVFTATFQCVMMAMLGILAVMEIALKPFNVVNLVLSLSAVVFFVHGSGKLFSIAGRYNETQNFLKRLENLRMHIIKYDPEEYLLKADNLTKKIIVMYSCCMLSYPLLSLINNFITDYQTDFQNPHLIHLVWMPLDMTNFWSYCFGTTFLFIMTVCPLLEYLVFCVVEFTFTMEMSAMLKILQYRLKHDGPTDITIYKDHQAIMKLMKEYQDLYSGLIFFEVVISSIQPSGFAYAFLQLIKTYDPMAFDLLYKAFACTIAPYVVCACGQELSDQFDNLHEFAYDSNWYELKPAMRKNLWHMMIITSKPTTINYKNLTPVNLACFAAILKGTYTYLTMMSNLEPK